jgi:hypothetical protein
MKKHRKDINHTLQNKIYCLTFLLGSKIRDIYFGKNVYFGDEEPKIEEKQSKSIIRRLKIDLKNPRQKIQTINILNYWLDYIYINCSLDNECKKMIEEELYFYWRNKSEILPRDGL